MRAGILIVGYSERVNKSTEIRADAYFKELLAKHDLGEIIFADVENYEQKLAEVRSLIVIVFNELLAQKLAESKVGYFIYLLEYPMTVLRRKSQKELEEKFEDMTRLIDYLKSLPDVEELIIRKVAAMDFNDKWNMIKQMLLSDKKDLQDKAWQMLNLNHGGWPWLRVKLIADCWNSSDAKRREEFLTIAMEQHVKSGVMKQIDDFVDSDGARYKQYEANKVAENGKKYIQRVPIATAEMSKYSYENLLDKTPDKLLL